MKYRPYWQRILFLAVVFDVILFWCGTSIFSAPKIEEKPQDDLMEIEWVETEDTIINEVAAEIPAVETFPEIVMPPLEIPHTVFEPLPELKIEPAPPVEVKPVEKPAEPAQPEKPAEEKKDNDTLGKLKVIAKVYPKDIIDQLVASGAIPSRVTLNGGKIVLSITVGVDGRVKSGSVEIRRGGGTDERGTLINLVAETAAGSWIFEPYLDSEGKPTELKTQIEFKPEDF